MKLLNTAIIRLALFLVMGILTGFYVSPPLSLLPFLLTASLVIFNISFFQAQKQLLQGPQFGSSCFLLFFFIGLATIQLHQPRNQALHYSNLISSEDPIITATIVEELKPDLYKDKFLAEVKTIDGKKTFGKILFLLPKDSIRLQIDQIFLIASELQPIPAPLNPQQFNYRRFMENRGILFQSAPSEGEFFPLKLSQKSYRGIFNEIHTQISSELKQYHFGKQELAILQALLLGQRRDISRETYQNFAEAGVVHILAVSGLHVGIILLILDSLLSPLGRMRRGKYLKMLLLILLLWGYALLAGLSPSIVRAVTMFSFVGIGMQLKRQTSVLNSLFLSLMFLLLFRPQWLFEVGFQLSYLAVFSIVVLQPRLYSLFRPRYKISRYFWSLFTVTLAAQVGVMPMSLYYFHQFPGLFFLSNLVILPFLGIILSLGVLVIFLSLLKILPEVLAETFNTCITLLNEFVAWVAQQEGFLFQGIYFSLLQLFAFYFLLTALLTSRSPFTFVRTFCFLCAVILLQGVYIHDTLAVMYNEFIIFHKSRYTVIGEKKNQFLMLSHNIEGAAQQESILKNYSLQRNISTVETEKLRNIYKTGNELLLVIDSAPVYNIPELRPHRILLISSPEINLEKLLLQLQPKEVIADGSNYRTYVQRWRETCRKKKIPFHFTGEKGSYILEE